jgi:hypothetical protein
MKEEFLKQFIGKKVMITTVGKVGSIYGNVKSVNDGILAIYDTYIDTSYIDTIVVTAKGE